MDIHSLCSYIHYQLKFYGLQQSLSSSSSSPSSTSPPQLQASTDLEERAGSLPSSRSHASLRVKFRLDGWVELPNALQPEVLVW